MYTLPKLPYGYSDLEPYIDEETMKIHHTKHHQKYTDKLNSALEKHPELFEEDLSELIYGAEKNLPEDIRFEIINNGGGFLNHSFFWNVLGEPKDEKNEPIGDLGKMIEEQYGSYEEFKTKFKAHAMKLFGSGWAWLTMNKSGTLELENTVNQNLPSEGKIAIITLDQWEHAYYLKYQNRREEYIDAFWHVVDWKKANERLKG